MLITSALVSGLGLGSMYGLLALGFYITYSVSSTVNFAQGSSMMLGAVFAYTFASAARLAAVGGGADRARALRGVRPGRGAGRGPPVRAARLERVADGHRGARHHRRQRRALHLRQGAARLPDAASLTGAEGAIQVFGVGVSPLQLAIPVAGLAAAAALHLFSRRTRLGKAMLAVVQNRDAARLMGINVTAAVMAAYAVSTVFAGVAGILIAPLFNVHSDMGTLFGLKAFAVAILGGITSAWGVMLAGLLFGSSRR